MKKETDFKNELYKKIRTRYPGTEVVPNDANYLQGFPDATVYLPNGKYFLLEGKIKKDASRQPNQEYYVDKLDGMSYAAFIHPGNKEDVLDALCRSFRS